MTVISMQRYGHQCDEDHMYELWAKRLRQSFRSTAGKRLKSVFKILEDDWRESIDIYKRLVKLIGVQWWSSQDLKEDHAVNQILTSGLEAYEGAFIRNKQLFRKENADDLRLSSFLEGLLDGAMKWLDIELLEGENIKAIPRVTPQFEINNESLLLRKRLYVELTDKPMRDYLVRRDYENAILRGAVRLRD